MLELVVKHSETGKELGTLKLEHSLIAIAEWESKFHLPFLSTNKTSTQMLAYIQCMTINKNVDPEVYGHLTSEHLNAISSYISDRHTATTFGHGWLDEIEDEKEKQVPKKKQEIITAELIYYWMIANQVPIEFQKWHIERLLTLIRVCAIKNTPPDSKKKGKRGRLSLASNQEMLAKRNALNAQRRAKLGSKG